RSVGRELDQPVEQSVLGERPRSLRAEIHQGRCRASGEVGELVACRREDRGAPAVEEARRLAAADRNLVDLPMARVVPLERDALAVAAEARGAVSRAGRELTRYSTLGRYDEQTLVGDAEGDVPAVRRDARPVRFEPRDDLS